MSNPYALFVYNFKSLDGLEVGADYFNILKTGKLPEQVANEANAKLKAISKAKQYVITDFRVSHDETQRFLKF